MLGLWGVYRAEALAKFLNIAARTPLFARRSAEKRSELLNGVRAGWTHFGGKVVSRPRRLPGQTDGRTETNCDAECQLWQPREGRPRISPYS